MSGSARRDPPVAPGDGNGLTAARCDYLQETTPDNNCKGEQSLTASAAPKSVPQSAQLGAARWAIPAPPTPVTAHPENKKKSWMGSASKSLGITKLRRRTSFGRGHGVKDGTTPPPSRTRSIREHGVSRSTHILLNFANQKFLQLHAPHNLAGCSRSPVPAPLGQQYQVSPPVPGGAYHLNHPSPPRNNEKPLPSIPAADAKYRSPVRKTLIDCTEKPLRRRSETPPDGDGSQDEEDWPTIEPTKTSTNMDPAGAYSQIKPSLGESLYEGMRGLSLKDNTSAYAQSQAKKTAATGGSLASTDELLSDGTSRPLSSSQVPKPRNSMVQSMSRHNEAPVLRHTKASALRMQQATGRNPWDPKEKPNTATTGYNTPLREQSKSPPLSRPGFQGVPKRTSSRGRLGVTGRGSPYTLPPSSLPKSKLASRDGIADSRLPSYTSKQSRKESKDGSNRSSTEFVNPDPQGARKGSLPLPSRLVRPSATSTEDQRPTPSFPAELPAGDIEKQEPGNITAAPVDNDGAASHETRHVVEPLAQEPMSVQVSSPDPAGATFGIGANSDDYFLPATTLFGRDEFGGYRIRRVGNNESMMGPTLRITNSATRVLLGPDTERHVLSTGSPVKLRRKQSAPDFGTPRATTDSERRSSAILSSLPGPMNLLRSFTERSLGRDGSAKEYSTRQHIGDSKPEESASSCAELAAGEIGSNNPWASAFGRSVDPVKLPSPGNSAVGDAPKLDHGDWPGKNFAAFAGTPERSENVGLTVSSTTRPARAGASPARPPTIVMSEPPSKVTAPFLYQDLKEEQAKREKKGEKLTDDLTRSADPDPEKSKPDSLATRSSKSEDSKCGATPFPAFEDYPPRTSSRKPKPPPILVDRLPAAVHPAVAAPKAYGVPAGGLKKPRNVLAFSQSRSPNFEPRDERNISGVLANSPPIPNKKKNATLRGWYQKKKAEIGASMVANSKTITPKLYREGRAAILAAAEARAAAATSEDASKISTTDHLSNSPIVQGENSSYHSQKRPTPSSFRRKPVPVFTRATGTAKGKRIPNPLAQGPSSSYTASAISSDDYLRPAMPWNQSPTTPWTASLGFGAYPSTAENSQHAHQARAYGQPGEHNISAPHIPPPTVVATPSGNVDELAGATDLAHQVLNAAVQVAHDYDEHKQALTELAKSFVEVLSVARDAEKAVELSRNEARKAEMAYIKCLQEVNRCEDLVKSALAAGEMKAPGLRIKEI
jgi:hypothetical protein